MKKTLLRVVCAIVVVMMALSVVVNAENKIGFTTEIAGGVVDGKLTVYAGYKDITDYISETYGCLRVHDFILGFHFIFRVYFIIFLY